MKTSNTSHVSSNRTQKVNAMYFPRWETFKDKSKAALILFIYFLFFLPASKQWRKRNISCCDTCHILSLSSHWGKNKTQEMTLPVYLKRTGASSEGCEITLAKSSGWSHHKEDKTKGHSEPWIICCCHPTPSHNPSLCDSLFWSYVMNGTLWSALSILLPQYSNNANISWPGRSEVRPWRTQWQRSRGGHFRDEFAKKWQFGVSRYACSEHPRVLMTPASTRRRLGGSSDSPAVCGWD